MAKSPSIYRRYNMRALIQKAYIKFEAWIFMLLFKMETAIWCDR